MKQTPRRVVGIWLICSAVLGLALTLVGIGATWLFHPRTVNTFEAAADQGAAFMDMTTQGLTVASQSLETSYASVATLDTTVLLLTQSISESVPMMESVTTLLGEDLPATIKSTQTSLEAAQASAKLIDGVLRAITLIPLISREPYNPDVPLSEALGQVSDSLDKLPITLETMEQGLTNISANMASLRTEVSGLSTNVEQIKLNLTQARDVVIQYQQTTEEMSQKIKDLRGRLSSWVTGMEIGLTVILAWLASTQVGLLTQGLDLLAQARKSDDDLPPEN